jgi:precorrin-6x reductase
MEVLGHPWQKVIETPPTISTNKQGVVVEACHPSYAAGISKRITDRAKNKKIKTGAPRTYQKNN